MKTIGGATLVGVLIALLVIYWLGPLNSGGVALVVLLCVSFANILGGAIAAFRKRAEEPGKPSRKKRGHHPKLLVLALLLAGCAGATHHPPVPPPPPAPELPPPPPPPPVPEPPPPPPPPPQQQRQRQQQQQSMHSLQVRKKNLPARGVLLRDQAPPAGYGAYGYVVFTARPDSSNLPLYRAVCQKYESSLQPVTDYSDVSPSHLMVTFWLLKAPPAASDCDALIASYDFGRATEIARTIGKLNVRGPILVAWRSSFKFGSANADDALVVDMSDFTSADDISEAFLVWRDRISQDPEVWNHGFNLAMVRVALRSFLNTYGQQVVAIIGGGGSH
jgi:hypothetical protein